jgi:hypothetical protein
MNVSELARRLRVSVKEMYEVLPNYGFDIGRRAVKVDDKIADSIIREWRRMYADWKEKQRRAKEQARIAEKEARRAETSCHQHYFRVNEERYFGKFE